jgi:hypothetical protein
VDIGEEDVTGLSGDVDVVLDVKSELEVVLPVLSFVAVVREDGVLPEDAEAVEVGSDTVEDDDVGGDEEEVSGKI